VTTCWSLSKVQILWQLQIFFPHDEVSFSEEKTLCKQRLNNTNDLNATQGLKQQEK
jgi:hypothetical protein